MNAFALGRRYAAGVFVGRLLSERERSALVLRFYAAATGGPPTGAVGLGAAAAALLLSKLRNGAAYEADPPLY